MTDASDSNYDVSFGLPGDSDIELLVMGMSPEDTGLSRVGEFLGRLGGLRSLERASFDDLATQAASIVRENRLLGPTAIGTTKRRSSMPRLAAATIGVMMLMGLTTVAVASDASAPGEPLYGIDRALERIGIGVGGVDERIVESATLIGSGSPGEALVFMSDSIITDVEATSDPTPERIRIHVDLATKLAGSQSAETQEAVASLQEFIEENKGKGVGVDGSDFGAGVGANPGKEGSADTESTGSQGQGQGQDNGQGQGRENRGDEDG